MTAHGADATARNARATQADVPYYVRGLALGIPAYLIGVHLWAWIFMAPFYLGGHSDFRQIYAAAQMVRTRAKRHGIVHSTQFLQQGGVTADLKDGRPFAFVALPGSRADVYPPPPKWWVQSSMR